MATIVQADPPLSFAETRRYPLSWELELASLTGFTVTEVAATIKNPDGVVKTLPTPALSTPIAEVTAGPIATLFAGEPVPEKAGNYEIRALGTLTDGVTTVTSEIILQSKVKL